MYQPPSGTQKTEQMWPLPVDLFGLAREMHTQILNDFGAKDPWSAPFLHGLQAGQRDGRWAPCPLGVWFGRGDKDLNTLQGSRSEERKQIGLCPKSL